MCIRCIELWVKWIVIEIMPKSILLVLELTSPPKKRVWYNFRVRKDLRVLSASKRETSFLYTNLRLKEVPNTKHPPKRVETSHKLTERLVLCSLPERQHCQQWRVPNTGHSVSLCAPEIQNRGRVFRVWGYLENRRDEFADWERFRGWIYLIGYLPNKETITMLSLPYLWRCLYERPLPSQACMLFLAPLSLSTSLRLLYELYYYNKRTFLLWVELFTELDLAKKTKKIVSKNSTRLLKYVF